ncbi:hypothetical protein BGAL_0004g00430 [Botrytis galanthina]|uniref:Rhodopsin domain-containing protein n=1 Tax=Botrytis galanthina TaxID=278940 RepID=A0A4S8RE36_9HELO|nr:hypothetical protein BGAL_0004g00430 [Botrytis galanthina]
MASTSLNSLPDGIDPSYGGLKLTIFTCILLVVVSLCVSLRFYTRWLVKAPWAMDDVLVFAALVFQTALAAILFDALRTAGLGYHTSYLEFTAPWKVRRWGKELFAGTIVYLLCATAPKYAILLLYKRLFIVNKVRICVYALMATLVVYTIVMIAVALAACRPFAANFDPTIPGAKCINKEDLYRWGPIVNIATDIAMLILPMPIIWNLHTTRRLKLGLTLTFLTGSLGLIISIIRIPIFFQANSFTDGTYTGAELMIWTQLETACYLISACLMTLRPLLEKVGQSRIVQTIKGSRPGEAARGVFNSPKPSDGRSGENKVFDLKLQSLQPSHQVRIHAQGFHRLNNSTVDIESNEILVCTDLGLKRSNDWGGYVTALYSGRTYTYADGSTVK